MPAGSRHSVKACRDFLLLRATIFSMITSIKNAGNLKGKRVLLRLDLNVPVEGSRVVDDFRIQKALPVLKFLRDAGARTIVLAHIESEEGTLLPVFEYLKSVLPVSFVKDFTRPDSSAELSALHDGDIALHENIRQYPGEKKNDPAFAKSLAMLGDLYCNDGFSVSHRAHASVVGVPSFFAKDGRFAGLQFMEEFENLSRALKPSHPFLFILGGAKFETKMPLVEKFLKLADKVFIGGALANDLLKEKGFEVGASLLSDKNLSLAAIANDPKMLLPSDVTLSDGRIVGIFGVGNSDSILDAGPQTVSDLKNVLLTAKFVLWNGPLGVYEKGFTGPTEALAEAIAGSGAECIVGGGDTLASIAKLGLEHKFSFLSTAGGAMLDFLANDTLPGIEALS